MDPYLERYWEGIHARLIGYIADALVPQLPEDLAARVEEQVYIDSDEPAASVRRPDVRVVEDPVPWSTRSAPEGGLAVGEPVILHVERDPITDRSVRIMDIDGNRLVTAIELLNPWNKSPGRGRDAYMRKRDEIFASEANLVEIDLVRAGEWVPMMSPFNIPRPYQTTCRVSVWRASAKRRVELYPIHLRDTLPNFRVPLRAGEPDIRLALQPLFDQAYRNGRYDRTDYRETCEPPLEADDAAWADELLKAAGRR